MKVTDDGVPLSTLIEVVKASVKRGGISRSSQERALQVASLQLILEVLASQTVGGGLDFRVPFIGMKLKLGAKVTKKDTHTIDITLIPPDNAARQVRGGDDVEEALVNAIKSIRTVTAQAAEGDDPWILAEGSINISFGITQAGTISLGMDGDLSGELTQTLRLRLEPPSAPC